ncbi:MAG: YdcF family protein [Clostridia bacterium]|nr:YdcF family protein [Clostridia bacterium]
MKKYDAILLLGYGLDENDQATQELRLRVKAAAKAYREGYSDVIVACGGTTEGHHVSEAEVMQALLLEEGVAQENILLENQSQITIENMRFAADALGGAKGKRVLVVTSDYHVRRSVLTAMRAGFRAKGYAAVLPHDDAWKEKKRTELPYTIDMLVNWNQQSAVRPKWMRMLFGLIYGKKERKKDQKTA